MTGRPRTEHGVVLPTRLMVFSISAVALAGLVFVATQGSDDPDTATPSSSVSQQPTFGPRDNTAPSIKPTETSTPTITPAPPVVVNKAKTNVVVFNNSNIKGLAGKTATKAQRLDWNVVATDNWYGTVDASTVYFGPKLKAAALALAKDLGIARVKPAIAPMQLDRLTVILTADYQ